MLATSRGFLKPPPSPPSTISPSTPHSTAFNAGQARHDVKQGESRRLDLFGIALGTAGRRRYELDALGDHEAHDGRTPHERLRDVHSERFVRELAHLLDLFADGVQLAGRGLDDAEPARVR